MKLTKFSTLVFVLLTACSACKKESFTVKDDISQNTSEAKAPLVTTTETFETGVKAAYADGTVSLATGVWDLNDALLGNTPADPKDETQSVRTRNSATVTTNFDYTTGASTVSVKHAMYGTDASGTWQLWYSTNGGTSYVQTGSTVTTNSTTLQTATFTINVSGNIRFQIRKTDGSSTRINFDDFSVISFGGTSQLPKINTVTPDSAVAGGKAFRIVVAGSRFTSTSTINWNGTPITTIYKTAKRLTANIPAADIATAGTASITVTSDKGTSAPFIFVITGGTTITGKKFLFDNTKAETAGNADWVIDEDNSTPQRIPTPAQSTITPSTIETYWTGALSSWGIALVKEGDYVETLPTTGSITYGNSSNPQDLSNYDVFVVDEPNILFTAAEKTAILQFVQNGGGLFMISDHTQSDRNNDGYDSPAIWNDLMTNNSVQTDPFGFSVDLTNISETSGNVLSNSSNNVILNGSQGTVTQMQYNNGATLTLQPSANSSVQGLIWQTGFAQGNTNVMCASSTFGTGRVFVVTDSSPMDDGTGASGNTLYVSWNLYSHTQLFMNASLWLSKEQ